jgi:uncharacterized membrane protein
VERLRNRLMVNDSAVPTTSRGTEPSSRRLLSARRALSSLAAGLATGAVVGFLWSFQLLPLVSWTVAVAVLLIWVWRRSWPQDAEGTKRLAEQEGTTRSTDVWLLLAAVASLGVVVVALTQFSNQRDATSVASVLLCVLSVVLSWALVNTVYAFKYARLYYFGEPDAGGIDFKQDQPPTYADFAYLAFTLGMSFAVSDTEPMATRIRRVALGHALLSYGFGTGVLAVAVNLVSNLGQ